MSQGFLRRLYSRWIYIDEAGTLDGAPASWRLILSESRCSSVQKWFLALRLGGPGGPLRVAAYTTSHRTRCRGIYQDDERGAGLKQSEQYTGLSPRGSKGTCASLPHWAHVAEYIWRCGRS